MASTTPPDQPAETTPGKKSHWRRHPVATALLAGLLLLATGGALFLATFDLNRHRELLQSRLSETLGQPVQLGEARLSLRHGLAIACRNLEVGKGDGKVWTLRAERLYLSLDLLPLLSGQVTFGRLLLDGFHAAVTLSPTPPPETKPPAAAPSPGRTPLVRSLSIRSGSVHFVDRRKPDLPFAVSLDDLEVDASNLAFDRPISLRLAGNLGQEGRRSPLLLQGEMTLPPAAADWRRSSGDLELQLGAVVPTNAVQRYLPQIGLAAVDGQLDLKLQLKGSPASGLQVDAALSSSGLRLHLPNLYRQPLPLQRLALSGRWLSEPKGESFNDFSVQLNELGPVRGSLALERREAGPWMSGTLVSAPLALVQLSRYIPDGKQPAALSWLKGHLAGGTVEIVSTRLDGAVEELRRFDADFPLRQTEIAVRDAALRLERPGPLRALTFTARLDPQGVAVSDGSLRLLDTPLRFAGRLAAPFGPPAAITMEASGALPSAALLALLPPERREGVAVTGAVPTTLTVGGTLQRLTVDLKADLQQLAVRRGEQPLKAAGRPGDLFLAGTLFTDRLELDHARLRLLPLEVRARGELGRQAPNPFRFEVETAPLDLKEAWGHFPVLGHARVTGEVSVQYQVAGTDWKVAEQQGTAYLRGFGLHLWGAVADIRDTSGQVRILTDRIDFEGLSAKVGDSPIRVAGSLENFAHPRLTLQVKSRTIRARDLIFPSHEANLRDVDGRLTIDADGIDFTRVAVHLDRGTDVVVRGRLSSFKQPQVNLDIDAEKADIDEVIALWHHSAPPPASETATAAPHEHKTTVRIEARVKEGVLGPLRFQNAAGVIGYADGVLNIQPLTFSAGPGRCSAQVSLEPREGRSMLKISGHLEDIDAEALQTEVLKQKGLITGTLSGDFYLEGEAGERFLSTSLGGFSVKIRDGLIYKFKTLAKVFSVLNVSQIFSLRLPDLTAEGMPFRRLRANVSLHEGVLSTEDLVVDSDAMNLSLVGSGDLVRQQLDLVLGVKPLRTVDKIVTKIPIAGWILGGEEKALVTVLFEIKGKAGDPKVAPMPVSSVSEKVLGVFRRVWGLPGKVVSDVGGMLMEEPKK